MDVPHRDRSTSTPSATGACASMVPEGVDPADRVLGEFNQKLYPTDLTRVRVGYNNVEGQDGYAPR
jgi:hypothetical protein